MTHLQALDVASYLNSFYTGPVDGIFAGCAAFADKRSCSVDRDGYWVYYVCSPFGAYLDGKKISLKEESDAVRHAREVLGIA